MLFEKVPQVGLEPQPEIPTAETIVLKFSKNTSKTSIDEGFERVRCLPQETQKSFQIADRQYKSSTSFLRRDACSLPYKASACHRNLRAASSTCSFFKLASSPEYRLCGRSLRTATPSAFF